MASVVGQRRKRAALEPGARVWANARREAEAPSEALTCAICMDVFDAVRACCVQAAAAGHGGDAPAPRERATDATVAAW
jgi:hypothetical protein